MSFSNFSEVKQQATDIKGRKWKMRALLLFFAQCIGSESTEDIRDIIDQKLSDLDTSADKLKDNFTFVRGLCIDNASGFWCIDFLKSCTVLRELGRMLLTPDEQHHEICFQKRL